MHGHSAIFCFLLVSVSGTSGFFAPSQPALRCSTNADCATNQECYAAGTAHASCIEKGMLGSAPSLIKCFEDSECAADQECYAAGTEHSSCITKGMDGSGRICCSAMTATCSACKAGVSVEDFCRANLGYDGCPDDVVIQPSLIKCFEDSECAADQECYAAGTEHSSCIAKGSKGATIGTLAPLGGLDTLAPLGGLGTAAPEADPAMCCKALTAQCLACAERMTVAEFCRKKPATQGCTISTCEECVAAQRSWQVGTCNPTHKCMVADAGCFEDADGCKKYEEEQRLSTECRKQRDCTACTQFNDLCGWFHKSANCAMVSNYWGPPDDLVRDADKCSAFDPDTLAPLETPPPKQILAPTCTLSGGEIVEGGWNGKDTGANYCNNCRCMNGRLACTRMACVPKSSTPAPLAAVKCTLSGGEIVEDGWNGKDTGANYCNNCRCMNGQLACTRMACVPKSSTPAPVTKTRVECRSDADCAESSKCFMNKRRTFSKCRPPSSSAVAKAAAATAADAVKHVAKAAWSILTFFFDGDITAFDGDKQRRMKAEMARKAGCGEDEIELVVTSGSVIVDVILPQSSAEKLQETVELAGAKVVKKEAPEALVLSSSLPEPANPSSSSSGKGLAIGLGVASSIIVLSAIVVVVVVVRQRVARQKQSGCEHPLDQDVQL